jgi:hypothetical protein
MTDTRNLSKDVQDQILDTIRKSQETVVDALKSWADSIQAITPSLPTPNLPFADKLPKPGELVSSAYDFAEQLLASQRKFAEDVISATTPVIETAKKGTGSAK